MLCLEILFGNEFFDIVDRNGRVDVAAGAGVLAGLVANAAADGGEGVFLLYELKSLGVAALRGELYVALNGNVRRALRLAGSRAGGHDVGAVGAVIDVVAALVPGHFLIRLIRVGNVRIARAQLLAESDGIGLAVFHALAAGDALVLIDPCDEVRAHALGGAEHLGYAQRVAGAAAAVADGGDAVEAGGLVHVVDKTVILGALEYLVGLLLADEAVLAVFGEVYGIVVEVHAHILFQMAAALAHEPARTAAGAGADGDRRCVFDDGRKLVVGRSVAVVLDGAHDGHDAHEVHAAAEHGSEHADADAGVLLKADRKVGVLLALFAVAEYALHDAGHPDGVVVERLFAVVAHAYDACLDELIALLLRKLDTLFRLLRQILDGEVLLKAHTHHYRAHIVVNDGRKDPVLGILIGDAGVGQALKTDLGCQCKDVRSVCHNVSPYSFLIIICIFLYIFAFI